MPSTKAFGALCLLCLLQAFHVVLANPAAQIAKNSIARRNSALFDSRSTDDHAELIQDVTSGACQRLFDGLETCYDCKVHVGATWDVCFLPGDYLWLDDDATLTNCMIDLHYREDKRCISVMGSPCEKVRGTSRIDLVEISNGGSIHGSLISSPISRSLQDASDFMVGEKVKSFYDDSNGDGFTFLGARYKGDQISSNNVTVLIAYGGEREC